MRSSPTSNGSAPTAGQQLQPTAGHCALWLPKKRRYCQFQPLDDGYCGHHKGGQLPPTAPKPHRKPKSADQLETERRRVPVQWVRSAGEPVLPQSVVSHKLFDHSLALELAALVCEGLALEADSTVQSAPERLSQLHLLPEGQYAQNHVLGRHCAFSKRWTGALDKRTNAQFRTRLDECIRRFVVTHVAEAVEASEHGWDQFVYQAEPSLRVHMPHTRPGIQKHKDFDYYHQPTELNFWIPLVPRVWGSNSLYCESSPGRGDFTAVEANLGQFLRFWGNQCEHYTVRNETEVTRVSIDLRVVPQKLFQPAWVSPKGRVAFRLGQYYTSTDHAECREVVLGDVTHVGANSEEPELSQLA